MFDNIVHRIEEKYEELNQTLLLILAELKKTNKLLESLTKKDGRKKD
jgi:hypothetical protein